jgi:hypothetical protein
VARRGRGEGWWRAVRGGGRGGVWFCKAVASHRTPKVIVGVLNAGWRGRDDSFTCVCGGKGSRLAVVGVVPATPS